MDNVIDVSDRKCMSLEALLRCVPDQMTMVARYANGELSWGPSIDAFRAELEAALPGIYGTSLLPSAPLHSPIHPLPPARAE